MTHILEITPPRITFLNDSVLIKHTRTSPFTQAPGAYLDTPCNAQHELQQLSMAGGKGYLEGPWKFLSGSHFAQSSPWKRNSVLSNEKKKSTQMTVSWGKNNCILLGFLTIHVIFVYKNKEWKAMVINHNGNKPQTSSCKREGFFFLFFKLFHLSLKLLHTFYCSLYVV